MPATSEAAGRVRQSTTVEVAGRAGLLAKAALYGIVGVLAIRIPLGLGGEATDRQGALRSLAQEPFGEVMLLALAVGLVGYAVWRFVQAFLDRDNEGDGLKGLAKRAGYLGRGLLYLGTAVVAFSVVAGWGGGGSNEKQETATVLGWPFGRYLVYAIGFAVLAIGVVNVYRACTQKFREDLREHQIADDAQPWVTAVGVVGYAARGVVFGLVGLFLVRAAWQYDPNEAIGLDGALRKVADAPYGPVLLGLVAAGLLAYAAFCVVQARYRRV